MAVITIGIAPELELGPLTIAWHGLTIAIGILVGGVLTARWLRQRQLDVEPLYTIGALLAVGGLVGGRVFYLLERDPSDLLSPSELVGTRGFTFAGALIVAAVLIVGYVGRRRLSAMYLDGVAFSLPLGVAVGRIGDVINGEHHGDRSTWLLAVRNSHPDALTPDSALAYHNGGLYEMLLALAIFAVVCVAQGRLRRVGDLTWLVLGLFAIGRFFEFFLRGDSPDAGLGLSNTQWTSLVLLGVVVAGWTLTRRHGPRGSLSSGDGAS